MSKIETAVKWALQIANDNSHGYDQANRWGPNYDCSSLVISAWENAGVPVKSKGGATYTGNMRSTFLANGFFIVTDGTLQRGDVLLNDKNHTAMYIGNNQLVQASSNENRGITGGQSGDQTGREIAVGSYYNFPWDCVLRYRETEILNNETEKINKETSDTYVVNSGDTLWSIAQENGLTVAKLKELNNLNSNLIYPNQVLKLKENQNDVKETVSNESDDNLQSGQTITVTVKLGDTLWSLAEEYLGAGYRYAEIAEQNGIASDNVNNIYVGQKLKIKLD